MYLPKTLLGKWSIGLAIAAPVLFLVGTLLVSFFYQSVPAGDTLLEDLARRPILVFTVLISMVAFLFAFISGIIAILKEKERALLVYVAVILGIMPIIFLLGEFILPHEA